MQDITMLLLLNLEKIGFGAVLFLAAYLSNMCLGAWRNVKIEGYDFDWKLVAQSVVKFVVLGVGIAILSMVISVIPAYISYVGIELSAETLETIDALVIISAFLTATVKYCLDGIEKLKAILGV